MDKSLFERMGGTYHLEGDYLLPDLSMPEIVPIGPWRQRHLWYIRKYKKGLYAALLSTGKLNSYLTDIDRQAEATFSQLVEQMARCQGVTERLKAENQMAWIGGMNNIQAAAMEIVNAEIIYA